MKSLNGDSLKLAEEGMGAAPSAARLRCGMTRRQMQYAGIGSTIAVAAIIVLVVAFSGGTSYDSATALSRAYYSKVAYCSDQKSLTDWTCKYCESGPNTLESAIVFEDKDTAMQTIVGYDGAEKAIALVFRGSSNIQNWILNAELSLVAWENSDGCDGCYVHEGFQRIWTSIRSRVIDALEQIAAKHGTRTLFTTGHSLGGAVAVQAALTLSELFTVQTIYTFGAPRVGNEKFASAWNAKLGSKSFRVVHAADMFVQIVNSCLSCKHGKYHHTGTEVWYETNDFSRKPSFIGDGSGEDPDGQLSLGSKAINPLDHEICEYTFSILFSFDEFFSHGCFFGRHGISQNRLLRE